jgi:hypothetical protein
LAAPGSTGDLPLLRPFEDLGRYSDGAVRLGFERMPASSLGGQGFGLYGLHIEAQDLRPWMDEARRRQRPSSPAALTNLPEEPKGGRTGASTQALGPRDTVLTLRFDVPVNRASFELRPLDSLALNVILHASAGGQDIGSLFYDVAQDFALVGVESARPFDELQIELTNPSRACFSLDNVVHELDLGDVDRDGWIDVIDLCPRVPGANQKDSDGDGVGDACDRFPYDPDNDIDGDGFGIPDDNCPLIHNPTQEDRDADGVGDACDPLSAGSDEDEDGIADAADNCPTAFNPEQADCDADGIGDLCDPSLVSPASVDLALVPGQCVTIRKELCLPPAPPVVDVLLLVDTTGSMGGEIRQMRQNLVGFVNGVRAALPLTNVRFGLATFRDYLGVYTSCKYSERYSAPGDSSFDLRAPMGVSDQQLLEAVNALDAQGGADMPEAYARALWEVTQPDSGIGFRPGSARFVLLVGDAPPHDCRLAEAMQGCLRRLSTGQDPGRDGVLSTPDDIDFQYDALFALANAGIPVLMLYSGQLSPCAWERWCAFTGGRMVHTSTQGKLPVGANLVRDLVSLILSPTVNQVTFSAQDACGLEVAFDPPFIAGPIDVSLGALVTIEETICVPTGTPPGRRECSVQFMVDEVVFATQTIHLDVGCTTYVLDFETEDDFATPVVNGQALASPAEFGRLVAISSAGPNLGATAFDSTPGGPNDPSINSDMLVGHGNLLLLQDSARPAQSAPGVFAQPTDDPDGGDLLFDFVAPVEPLSLLLADINPPPNLGTTVTLLDGSGRRRLYTVEAGWTGPYGDAGPHRLDLTRLDPQPGNGTPRYARATQDQGFQSTDVVRIVVHLTGFGAVDELTFCR